MRGRPQSWKDTERAYPRSRVADLGHPAMQRLLPEADAVRVGLSSRQRKARSKAKYQAWRRLPQRTYEALHAFLGTADEERGDWRRLNDQLSDAAGDLVQIPHSKTAADIRRVDRAIQAYEAVNDRGHVVYANVRMPFAVNHSNIEGFARNQFEVGSTVAFDRYTSGAQTLHEVERSQVDNQRTCVFEIQTRRGAYMGRSDSRDDTAHLLPRGMRLRVAGSHVARFRRPDGSEGERVVIQLVDDTKE